MPRLESKQADRSSSRRHHNRGDDEEEKNEGAAAAAAAAIQFSDDDDGGGIFSNGGGGGGSQVLDAGLSEAEAKRLEKISVKAWLIRKQHYTPLVDMLPRLIKFLNGDFDPLDDEEDHGIPLWRRFMDSCDEGECHHFVGRCMAAVHTFIGRRYRAIGYTQSNSANTKAGGGRAAKKSVKASDWPTDLGRRFTNFLCHKDTEFVFENVPVKPSFYERYSKYGKRSFEKIRKDDGGDGDGDGSSGSDDDGGRGRGRGRHAAADDSEKPTHMKTRVVFAYGVAQKGKAPKPLKPDEILTNQLFKRQCKVMWGKLLRETEDLVHNMVNRELYKRSQDGEDAGDSDDDADNSDEEYAPNKRASGMNVETTLTDKSVKAGEKLRRKARKSEITRLEDAMYQKLGLQLLQRWFNTAQEESERFAAEKMEEEAAERRRTATLLIRKKKLAQIAVPKELLNKIQAGAAQSKPRRFDFSRGKTKLNRAKHHNVAQNSLQMATQLGVGQHKGFIHSFANVDSKAFGVGGDVYECRRALLRMGYVHKSNFTDEDGVFDEAKYEEGKAFAERLRQRKEALKAAIYDKSDAKAFNQKKPLVARALKCLKALKAPQPYDKASKDIWRSVGKLLKKIDRSSLLEPWIQWSCRDGFGVESSSGASASSSSNSQVARARKDDTRRHREAAAAAAEGMRRFRFVCTTYWNSFKPIGCDIHNNLDSKYRYNLMKIIRKSGIDFEEMFAHGYRAEFRRKQKIKEDLGSEEELEEDPDFVDDAAAMEDDIDEGRAWLTNRAFVRTLRNNGVRVPPSVVHQLLHCLDPNRDGRVTMNEFVRFIKDKAMKHVRCVWDEVCPVCGMRPAFRTLYHKDKRSGQLIRDDHGAPKPFKSEISQHKQMRRQKTWRQAHEKRRMPPPKSASDEDDDFGDYADDMSEISQGSTAARGPYLPKCPKKCQAKSWGLQQSQDALEKLVDLANVDLEAMRINNVLAEIKVPSAPQVWQNMRPYERWQRRFHEESFAGDRSAMQDLLDDFSSLTQKLWICYTTGAEDDFVEFYTVEVFYGGDWFLLKTDPETSDSRSAGNDSADGGGGDSYDGSGYSGEDEPYSDDGDVSDGSDADYGLSGDESPKGRGKRRKSRQSDDPVRKFCWAALPRFKTKPADAKGGGKKSSRKLTPNTTYKIRVRAYNMHGASPFTQLFCTTAPQRPRAPKFKGCTASSVTYSWADKSTVEIQALRALFQQLDKDGNGLIERGELLDGINSSDKLHDFLSEVQLSARATRKLLSLEAQAEREQESKTRGGKNTNSVLHLLRMSSEENDDPITWPFFKSLLGSAALGDAADKKASTAQSFDTQTRYRLDQCTGTDNATGREMWVSCHGEGDASSTVNSQFTVKGLAQGSRCMFRLIVINRCGIESPPSEVVIGCTKLKAPDAPKVPEGNSISHTAVRLSLPKLSAIGTDSAAARAHSNQQRILKWQSTQAGVKTAQEKLQIVHGINLSFIFDRYDEDGSGSISPEELQGMLKDLGAPCDPESVERAVTELDQDNSGDISFDEFITWWLSADTPRYIVLMSKGLPQSASLRDMGGRVGVFDTHMTGAFKPSSRVQKAAAAAAPQHNRHPSAAGSSESIASLMGKGWVEAYRGTKATPIIKGLIPNTAYQFKLQLASASSVSLLSTALELHTAPERIMDPGPVIIAVGPRWIKLKWYSEASGAARWIVEARAVSTLKNKSRSAGSHPGTPRKLNTTAGKRALKNTAKGAAKAPSSSWTTIAETRGVDSTAHVHLKHLAGSESLLHVRVVGLNSQGVRSLPSQVREVDMSLAHSEEMAESTPYNAETIFDIDCTGDVVVGDTIVFTEKVYDQTQPRRSKSKPTFESKHSRGDGNATTVRRFAGSRTVAAVVLGEDWVLHRSDASERQLKAALGSSKQKKVSRTLILHVIWSTVQQREMVKKHSIAPAKRIKRTEASLYQFETLRRAWVDEDLRLDLRSEVRLRRESEQRFSELLKKHHRHQARLKPAHRRSDSRSHSRSSLGDE